MIRFIFLSSAAFMFFSAENLYAYRPLGTEDAGVAGRGVVQTEISWDYLKWKNGNMDQILLLVPIYGITDNLELSFEIPYLFHETEARDLKEGIGDINLVAKYLLIQEEDRNPSLAVKGVVKMDNGDYDKGLGSGDRDYSLFAIASKSVNNFTLHGQLGYTWIGDGKYKGIRDIIIYGIAVDYGIIESFHFLAEVIGNRHPHRHENEHPLNVLSGVTYSLSDKVILDFAYRRGLTNPSPEWSTTGGVSITF